MEKEFETLTSKIRVNEKQNLFVKCFGNFYAKAEKQLVWRTKKCSELFAYLFSRQGKGISNERIIDILWENKTADSAKTLFYTTLSYLRKELEQAGFPDMIQKESGLYYLDMKHITSDYEKISQIIQKKDTEEICRKEIEELVSLYTGRYMEGMDGEWLIEHRENVECYYLKKIQNFSQRLVVEQRYEEAVLLLKKGLSVDIYSEVFSGLLITCYVEMGEERKAVAEYKRIKKLFDAEFGVGIEEELGKIYQSLLKYKS